MTSVQDPAAAGAALDAAAGRMRALAAGLPRPDGVAVFASVYLAVTDEVRVRLAAGGFADRTAAAGLAADFAGRFLAAVDDAAAGRRPPACWRPLFQARRHRGVHPLQFALAGINAHIGYDLPLAVVASCRTLGREPEDAEGDFERVGELLVRLEERIREQLMPGPDLLDVADPLTHFAGAWSLERARDAAWAAARVLWRLRGLPEVGEEFTERLDQSVGLVSRCVLVPLRGACDG
ncbi:DUF5995 family protein [Streptomyces sp. MAR4 CNX-425]|uniref:DUF5995 family protein n=1 Tax=Streptomyces sp. MAR4 CNX-425 TaxID=3406343 RepID=UPI003B506C50